MNTLVQEKFAVTELDLIDGSGEVNSQLYVFPDYIRNLEDLNGKLRLLGLGKEAVGSEFGELQKLLYRLHKHHPGSLVHSLSVLELVSHADATVEVKKAAVLHDVEKASVPVEILRKPSGLTSSEIIQMRGHAYAGWVKLSNKGFSSIVTSGALSHHIRENSQSMSYPAFSKESNGDYYIEGIPVAANDFRLLRKIALADSLDAMTRMRSYTIPKTVTQAETILRQEIESGSFGEDREYVHSVLTSMLSIVDYYYRVVPLYDSAA